MRRLTNIEKKAALAVAGMTIAVVGTGIKLIRRHTKYVMEKAAAFFEDDEIDFEAAEAETAQTEPETAEPETAGPEAAELEATEPEVTEPEAAEADAARQGTVEAENGKSS